MKDPHQDITTEIYNSGAEKYKNSSKDFVFPGGMFECFLEEINGNKILDIGCAFGRDISRLRDSGYESYGVEVSKELIALADEDIKNFITLGDISNISEIYKNQSFNAIMSSASLVHMDKGIVRGVLKDIYNLLTYEGIFFITLKISESSEIAFKESISLPGIEKKYVYYKQEEIQNILRGTGFDILKTHILETDNDNWISIIGKKYENNKD